MKDKNPKKKLSEIPGEVQCNCSEQANTPSHLCNLFCTLEAWAVSATSMDLQLIREQSIQLAKRLGVDVPPTLPLLDTELEMRSPDETISRILAMNAVAATAYGFDKAKALAWLNEETLRDLLSEQEKRFVFEDAGQVDRFKVQVEGMWALAWAMGIVNQMNFGKDCDNRFAAMLPNPKASQSSGNFRKKANRRPVEQVVAACIWLIAFIGQSGNQRSPANVRLET